MKRFADLLLTEASYVPDQFINMNVEQLIDFLKQSGKEGVAQTVIDTLGSLGADYMTVVDVHRKIAMEIARILKPTIIGATVVEGKRPQDVLFIVLHLADKNRYGERTWRYSVDSHAVLFSVTDGAAGDTAGSYKPVYRRVTRIDTTLAYGAKTEILRRADVVDKTAKSIANAIALDQNI